MYSAGKWELKKRVFARRAFSETQTAALSVCISIQLRKRRWERKDIWALDGVLLTTAL